MYKYLLWSGFVLMLSACGGGDEGDPSVRPSSAVRVSSSVTSSQISSVSSSSVESSIGSISSSVTSVSSSSSSIGSASSGETRETFFVTASAETGGSINPTFKQVFAGVSTSFSISPYSGFAIDTVTGCGGTLSEQTYTTGIVVAACTISATYKSIASTSSVSSAASSTASSASAVSVGENGLWSNPDTWPGGVLPNEGDDVSIPNGVTVVLDISPPALGSISINGSLKFENKALNFTAHSILVHGLLEVGTESQPITQPVVITLTGTDPSVSGSLTRGIVVMMGGILDLHGEAPQPTWTRLSANSGAGATQLSVVDSLTSWKAGDEIVIAPTDFMRVGRTERATIGSAGGRQINLSSSIQKPRWGALQYVNSSGVTLSPTTSITSKVIDQRAEVGNISRNIVIQGLDDSRWRNDGFGAHVMIMRPGEAFVDGVQFKRAGQAGILARYPIHWHLWSYSGSQMVGDAVGQYVKNSAIVSSSQRCVVIHGTNGVTIEDNICYDIHGHAMFLEDAVERRNIFEGNLVLKVELPLAGRRLQEHERFHFGTGPAGFWLTNPDNTVRNNVVADSVGNGFWLAYPSKTLGANKAVNLKPYNMSFGVFDDNTAHSNGRPGLHIDNVPNDDAGNLKIQKYEPKNGSGALIPFTINRFAAYKHESVASGGTFFGGSSMWNRVSKGLLTDFIVSDYAGAGFAGTSTDCTITKALVVGTTLNNANTSQSHVEPMGAASYHSLCEISNNIFVNIPGVPNKASGVFGTEDYYITGVDKGLIQNANSVMINSHAGYRMPSKNTLPAGVKPQGNTNGQEHYAYSGALWDPYGYWGPAENYWVYDEPFFTDGTACVNVNQPIHNNDKSCKGPYYGVSGQFRLNNENTSSQSLQRRPIRITREGNNEEWFVDDGGCTPFLGNMRHFAAVKGGSYIVAFPAGENAVLWSGSQCSAAELADAAPLPTATTFKVTNILEPSDVMTLAIPFHGSVTPTGYVTSYPSITEPPTWSSYRRWEEGDPDWRDGFRGDRWSPLERVDSRAALDASGGSTYWQDSSNDLLWLRITRVGMPNSGNGLYGTLGYVINSD